VNDTPIRPIHEAAGIRAYDLAMPEAHLYPLFTPWLLRSPEEIAAIGRRAERERRETEARIAREAEDALAEWRAFREQHADNPMVAAVLDIHQPEAGHRAVVCTECLEDDCDGATPAEWGCGTYNAMRRAR
jgi:hypothetical protein